MKLIIGDITEYLSDYAKSLDKDAYLVDHSNADQKHTGIIYTSLGDVSLAELHQLMLQANEIIYYPPEEWSDSKLELTTKIEMWRCSGRFIINGIDKIQWPDTSKTLVDQRKSNKPQLWTAGCSLTFGLGVRSDKAWPKIVSDQLALELSNLSWPGSSIRWSADQILRSDIQKGDIVIWGLTSPYRFPCYDNKETVHVTANTWDKKNYSSKTVKKYYNPDLLIDGNITINESLLAINTVSNFCNKVGARLFLIGLLDQTDISRYMPSDSYLNLSFQTETDNLTTQFDIDGTENLILPNYIDHGSDGRHPGPKQHADWAKRITEWIHTQF
jgi:hypothetical protein